MTQLLHSRRRLVRGLAWTVVALVASAGVAAGAQQPEATPVQTSAAVQPTEASVVRQQSVQEVSDALGQRLERMIADKRPLPLR